MTPLGEYHLGQIAQTLHSLRSDIIAAIAWLKRAMILVGLYGSGLLLLLLSDEKAKLAADLIKAIR